MRKIVFSLLALGLIITTYAQSQGETTIKQLVVNFDTAFNKKDAKATANFWADDGDYLTHFGDFLHGRKEIEKYFQNVFDQYYHNAQIKMFPPTIRFLKTDIAAVDVKWEILNATTPDGKPMPTFRGVMIWTMKEENGNWYIKIMHNASLP